MGTFRLGTPRRIGSPRRAGAWAAVSGLVALQLVTGVAFTAPAHAAGAVPGQPTFVEGIQTGEREMAAVWDVPEFEGDSPVLFYTATASPGGATCTADPEPDWTYCYITGLTEGESYTFTVVATNDDGDSAPSDPSIATRVLPLVVPAAPVITSVDPATGQVTWTQSDNGGPPVYRYVATASPGGAECRTSGLSCTIEGLSGSVSITVVAANIAGESAPSEPSSPQVFTPSAVTVTAALPGAPVNVAFNFVGRDAVVTWTPPESDGGLPITQYDVRASLDGVYQFCTATTSTTCTFYGLEVGKPYVFDVAARNAAGRGARVIAQAAIDTVAPLPVRNLSGIASVNSNRSAQVVINFRTLVLDGRPVVRLAPGSIPPKRITDGIGINGLSLINTGYVYDHSARGSGFPIGPIAVSVFMVDASGNVSEPRSVVFMPTILTATIKPTVVRAGQETVAQWVIQTPYGFRRHSQPATALVRTLGTAKWKQIPLVTDAKGRATLKVKLAATAQIALQYGGGAEVSPAVTKAFVVKVAPAVTSVLSAPRVRRRAAATMTGSVYPARRGQPVYLQQLVGKTWRNVAITRMDVAGRFRFALPTQSRGVVQYRAYRPATPVNLAGASGPQVLTVS